MSISIRALALTAISCAAATAATAPKTVWDGVYTTAQASRGEAVYSSECAGCHRDDLTGYGSLLIGNRFLNDWREDSLNSFFTVVKNTMPRNAPASLSDREYVDLVAYVLKANSFPPGENELTPGALTGIRVEGKNGPEPVPDFALVEVIGCLEQGASGEWVVAKATEPVRTRNPKESTPEELNALRGIAPGTHTFHLLDASDLPKRRKVLAKGFLIRKPGDDRLNPTAVQALGTACEP